MVVLFRACNCLLQRADPLPHGLRHLTFPLQQLVVQTPANAEENLTQFESQNMVMNQNKNRTNEWKLDTAALNTGPQDWKKGFLFRF